MRALKALPIIGTSGKKRASGGNSEKRKAKSEASEYLDLGMRELKALPIIGTSGKKHASWEKKEKRQYMKIN